MKHTAYIFDVDGVLNNLRHYDPDPRILAHIVRLLESGVHVAINTGRGYEWIDHNVVQPITRLVQSPAAMDRFFVAVEMGGLGVEFTNGAAKHVKSAFSLTTDQIAQVKQVYAAHPEYAATMGWYVKESMATLDKHKTTSLEDYQPDQKALTAVLQEYFAGQHVTVANSTDAIDIHAPEAGKWAGAQLVYEWLQPYRRPA